MSSGSLWNYYRDEINDNENKNDANEDMINNNKTRQVNLSSVRQK